MEFNEKNIFNAIKHVAEWQALGIQLGFKKGELSIIKYDSRSTNEAIISLIDHWINNDKNASWKQLDNALQLMGERKLSDSFYCGENLTGTARGKGEIEDGISFCIGM